MRKLKRAITITISITFKVKTKAKICLWPWMIWNAIHYLPTQLEVLEVAL
jgi:hypothetical protein